MGRRVGSSFVNCAVAHGCFVPGEIHAQLHKIRRVCVRAVATVVLSRVFLVLLVDTISFKLKV